MTMLPQRCATTVHAASGSCLEWRPRPCCYTSCKRDLYSWRQPCRRSWPQVAAAAAGAELAMSAASAAADLLQAVSGQAANLASDVASIPPEQAAQLTMNGITAAAHESISSRGLSDSGMELRWSPYSLPLCAWQAYCSALEANPLQTKLLTALVGTIAGDVTAQYYMASQAQQSSNDTQSSADTTRVSAQAAAPFQYDALRTARLMAFSALLGTPMGHYEYEMLEKVVMPSDPTSPMAVALKVGFDQLIQTPIGMSLFFGSIKLMEGRPSDVLPTLHAKVWPSLLANWSFWPAAQLINFTLVPLNMRILYVNLLCIVWTAYISLVANTPTTPDAAAADAAGQPQPRQPLPLPVRSMERLRVDSRVRAVLGGLRKA